MQATQTQSAQAAQPRNAAAIRNATLQAELPSQYLTFMLAGEVYAIGILAIKEIIEHGNMTRVPMMPDAIRGVINLRGAVVPVIDLGVRFGHGPSVLAKRTCIVIVEVEREGEAEVVGILVDAVNEVKDIPAGEIEPAPSFGTRINTEFIAGMARIADRFVIVLDPARVLSVEQMAFLAPSDVAGATSAAANDAAAAGSAEISDGGG